MCWGAASQCWPHHVEPWRPAAPDIIDAGREVQATEELAWMKATVAQADKVLLRCLTDGPYGSRISAYEAFRRDVLECVLAKPDDETRAPSERHVEVTRRTWTTARH